MATTEKASATSSVTINSPGHGASALRDALSDRSRAYRRFFRMSSSRLRIPFASVAMISAAVYKRLQTV
eukprot:458374-Prymnesium_polylepis.1